MARAAPFESFISHAGKHGVSDPSEFPLIQTPIVGLRKDVRSDLPTRLEPHSTARGQILDLTRHQDLTPQMIQRFIALSRANKLQRKRLKIDLPQPLHHGPAAPRTALLHASTISESSSGTGYSRSLARKPITILNEDRRGKRTGMLCGLRNTGRAAAAQLRELDCELGPLRRRLLSTNRPRQCEVDAKALSQVLQLGVIEVIEDELSILAWAGAMAIAFHLFVVLYEEPSLANRFGAPYEVYRRTVRRWWPRRP